MKAASLSEIKAALAQMDRKSLIEICVRLAKLKEENKQLASYLLFDAENHRQFMEDVKNEIRGMFEEINMDSVYYIKKSIRKILRVASRYIRFVGSKSFEAEILIYFCNCMANFDIPVHKSTALMNIDLAQRKKIQASLKSLHPDLQYDLNRELKPAR